MIVVLVVYVAAMVTFIVVGVRYIWRHRDGLGDGTHVDDGPVLGTGYGRSVPPNRRWP